MSGSRAEIALLIVSPASQSPALVTKPRVNLTRFHGVFAPNSKRRALIAPAKRGRGREASAGKQGEEKTPFEHRVAMTWAQRLKRVFAIEVETCGECGGAVKVIASIASGHLLLVNTPCNWDELG